MVVPLHSQNGTYSIQRHGKTIPHLSESPYHRKGTELGENGKINEAITFLILYK